MIEEQMGDEDGRYNSRWERDRLVQQLMLAGRTEVAFEMQMAALQQTYAASTQATMLYSDPELMQEQLIQLAGIYHQLERHADVLALLESAPWWGARDLAGIELQTYRGHTPLHQMAAAALADAGRNDEAIKILHALINQEGGYDPAYELLVKLQGDKAEPFLRAAFERDQFEERPLIWLGVIKLQQKELDEAQALLQQAISIDPSDGEQGKGDRMRVYAVLADVMAAKGDKEQERFLRDVVRAIRMSEDADDLHEAGLLREGIDLYLESVGVFADAYCIQSRLAIQLMELGLFEQAKEHYRRAFELMPDSFGRMESHCFGCEGAFSGELATSIAEDVFQQLARQRPNDPKVHYLLGYLRSSQERDDEAVKAYRRAVELDPDYINAWDRLSNFARQGLLTREENGTIALNLIRLDPLGNHGRPDMSHVHNLAAVWKALEKAEALHVEVPKELLTLTASAKAGVTPAMHDEFMMQRHRGMMYEDNDTSPAAILARSSILSKLTELHQMVEYAGMRY